VSGKKLNLLVVPKLFPAGAGDISGIFVLDYLRAVEPFCDVTVLDNRISGRARGVMEERLDGVRILRVALTTHPVNRWLKPFYYLRWFAAGYQAAAALGEMDVIHTHGSTLAGNLALLIARRKRVPVVMTEHTRISKLMRGPLLAWLTRRALERADCVLLVSDDLRRQVAAAGIGPNRCEVTFNPVDTDMFRPTNPLPLAERRNILFAGRLEPYKGALRTVRAFGAIAATHPGWRLTIVGNGTEQAAIEALVVGDPALRDRVRLTGQLTKQEIAHEMNDAALLMSPSEHETFGIVVAEAMACGLPVIIGDEAAPIEFVNESAGRRVPASDVAALAQALRDVIASLDRYDSAAIRDSVVRRFGLEAFGARLRAVYESV